MHLSGIPRKLMSTEQGLWGNFLTICTNLTQNWLRYAYRVYEKVQKGYLPRLIVSDKRLVEIENPKYAIGADVVALINNQLRHATVEQAYLQANIVVDETGMYVEGALRWEYLVLVINDPVEASEKMVITERTIISRIDDENDMRDT